VEGHHANEAVSESICMEDFERVETYDDPAPLSDGEPSRRPRNETRRSYIDNGPKILGFPNREGLEIGLSLTGLG